MASLISRLNDVVAAIGADIKALFTRSMPSGGIAGQVLTKASAADYNATWANPSPKITVSDTAPSSPAVNDIWIDTN